jgi:hypothetical protein
MTLPLDSSLVICQMYAIFLPYSCPSKKHTKLSYKPFFAKSQKTDNSSSIIAADGLLVMNFFGGDGVGVSSLFFKLSPTKSASKIQMHLCGQDWHLDKNGIP